MPNLIENIGNLLRDIFNFSFDRGPREPGGRPGRATTKDLLLYQQYRNEQTALNAAQRGKSLTPVLLLDDWMRQGYPKAR